MKFGNIEVEDFAINPMKGFGNDPSITLFINKGTKALSEPSAFLFHKVGAMYWAQREDGLTKFLVHNGELTEQEDGSLISTKDRGFGGSKFTLPYCKMPNGHVKTVHLVGPWSSGCYAANQYLPKKAKEVVFLTIGKGRVGYGGLSVTFDKLNTLLANFGWSVQDDVKGRMMRECDCKSWPTFLYKGEPKRNWSKDTISYLQKEYEYRVRKFS